MSPHLTPDQAIPPVPPVPVLEQSVVSAAPRTSAADMYNAMRAQRTELKRQLESLEDKRSELTRQVQSSSGSSDRVGLEARIKEMDARISSVDQEIAASEAAVAKAAAIPGAVVQTPPPIRNGPPEEAFALGGLFMVIVLLPLSIALARRMWRRGSAQTVTVSPELSDRFTRLEQAVDAIAVEVERVGEGQRYISRQFSENASRALGPGAAEPIELRQREQVSIDQRR